MKEKLLETATCHFSRLGFEGAATRAIAADANTAMSSITYHFGGKEGLYIACARHIAEHISARFDPILDSIGDPARQSRDQAVKALHALLEGFARIMLDPQSERWSGFIVREQQAPTKAFDELYSGMMNRVIETVVSLIRCARSDLSEPQARACAVALWGQAMTLRITRASVCRVMGVETLDTATARILIDQFHANTELVLTADMESSE
ncbi:CerR family C-terminal domain-containing protein [Croceicoccus mobilis]|uniref:HTH tetR-type domain-containing protein n=1 Tax=Croceicoccus mobilis TaxID=1703339 RepID=A0A917DUA0_9SPHN|nr:CerR family C-terminal domain-containing protein [Croceicoccus mobilis]GGD69466.1 hypothetical protein GCM10010990_18730 [Croceicoccus mobilis]